MKKRLLSLAMALCMVLSLLPATAFADENAETPVCTCKEACTSEDMDAECPVCGAEDATVENCCKYAAPATETQPESTTPYEAPVCTCEEACTAEAMNTECPVCSAEGASVEDCCKYVAPEQDGSTEATTSPETPVCSCEDACTADAMDAECPVCGAEGAVVENCGKYIAPVVEEQVEEVVQMGAPAGEEPELTAVEKVQAMIDALPTVEELENADDETVDAVYATVQDVYDALDELSTEELDQITGLDKLAALMEWFTGPVSTFTGPTDASYFNFDKTTGTINGLTEAGKTLTEIVIPDTIDGVDVTTIGSSAFYNCTSLTSITIPDGVTSIGSKAFSYCSNLASITIPDSVTSIGDQAFYFCRKLTSITIPNSVTSIGSEAFSYCNLASITIPDSMTSIGYRAFFNCSKLASITIPDSVTSIGNFAFTYCRNLASITIPNSVTSIGSSAFYMCTSLASITIPNSVTSIGDQAFYGCTSLTSITIPNSVTSIGDQAFHGCTSLTSIEIPSNVTSVGALMFQECTNLTSITIPNSVTSIGDHAFFNCSKLASITIPDSVTSIGYKVFHKCTSLESIFLPKDLDVTNAEIPDATSQVRYSLDTERGEVTITGIELGTGKTGVAIPATICGYPVVAAEDGLLESITSHTCAGGEANCQTKAICGICKQEYGNYADHTLTKIKAKDSTCTEDGNIEYWTCSVCRKLFSDEGGTTETTLDAVTIKATGHPLTKIKAKDSICTEDGNIEYWTCSVCRKLFSDEYGTNETTLDAVTIKAAHKLTKTEARDATVTETGNIEYWQCQDCGDIFSDPDGKNEIAPEDTVTAKLPPKIIEGAEQSVTAGEKKALSFRSNAAFSDFIRVELDGKTLAEKNYTAKEGSTVVTLNADYVSTLSSGEHTIGIVSESGTASTTFTVDVKTNSTDSSQTGTSNTNTPQTGDNSPLALWIALLFVSGGLLTFMGIYGKKKKYNR